MKAGFYRPDRIGCRSAWVASGPSELYHSKGRFRGKAEVKHAANQHSEGPESAEPV